MRFRCEKPALAAALKLAQAAAGKSRIKPELRQVLLAAEGGAVEACATDGENGLAVRIAEAEAVEPGQVLVPGDFVLQILGEWPVKAWEVSGEGVETRLADAADPTKTVAEFHAERRDWAWKTDEDGQRYKATNMVRLKWEEYPADLARPPAEELTCAVDAAELGLGLRRLLPCADEGRLRFATDAVLLAVGDNRLDLYATDEKQVGHHRIGTLYAGMGPSALISTHFAGLIARACEQDGSAEHPAEVAIRTSRVVVRVGGVRLAGRTIEGRAAPCEQILGQGTWDFASVALADLQRVIRLAAAARPTGNEEYNLWLEISKGGLTARVGEFGYAEAFASLIGPHPEIEAPWDYRFLSRTVLPLDGDERVEVAIAKLGDRPVLRLNVGATRFLFNSIATELPAPRPRAEAKPRKRAKATS